MALPPRTPLQQKLCAASHYVTCFLGLKCPRSIPMVFVLGYPKSGTTWAAQLVADYLQMPFPQLSLLPIGFQAVIHGHFRPRDAFRQMIYQIRDGRDVFISLYFQLAREIPEGDHPPLRRRWRKMFAGLINKNDVRRNLPAFLEYQMKHPFGCRLNWSDHYRRFLDVNSRREIPLMRYEDLLADTETVLARAMSKLLGEQPDMARIRMAVEKYRFARQAGREPGIEDRASLLRKGQAGDWRSHFTREAAEIFDRCCGDALIEAGYEKDRSWVELCPDDQCRGEREIGNDG